MEAQLSRLAVQAHVMRRDPIIVKHIRRGCYKGIAREIAKLGTKVWTTRQNGDPCWCGCPPSYMTPLETLLVGREGGRKLNSGLIKRLIDNGLLPIECFAGEIILYKLESISSWNTNFRFVKYLLSVVPADIWVNARDEHNRTVFHAADYGTDNDDQYAWLCDAFFAMGCDPTVITVYGENVLTSLISRALVVQARKCITEYGMPIPPGAFREICDAYRMSKTQEDFTRCIEMTRRLQESGYEFTSTDHAAIAHYEFTVILGFVIPAGTVVGSYTPERKPRMSDADAFVHAELYQLACVKSLVEPYKYCKDCKDLPTISRLSDDILRVFNNVPWNGIDDNAMYNTHQMYGFICEFLVKT